LLLLLGVPPKTTPVMLNGGSVKAKVGPIGFKINQGSVSEPRIITTTKTAMMIILVALGFGG